MGFVEFKKGSAPVSTVPSVTIQKRGLFSLNDAAYKLLGEPTMIKFMWDPEARLIALTAADPTDLNGYPARRQGAAKATSRSPVLIAGSMFTRFIRLDTSEAKRWVPRLEGDLLIIDLNDEGAPVRSNRTARKASPESPSRG